MLPTVSTISKGFRIGNVAYAGGQAGTLLKWVKNAVGQMGVWQALKFLTTEDISDLYFWNELEGMALSYNTVYRTTDGGLSWTIVFRGSGFTRFDFSGNSGMIVGMNGLVVITTDRGSHWTQKPFFVCDHARLVVGATSDLRNVKMLDASTAIIVGQYGAIAKTVDLGNTFSQKLTTTQNLFLAISAGSANVLVATGRAGIVYKSTDAGETWSAMSLPSVGVDLQSVLLSDVRMVNEQVGYIVGTGGLMYRTTDGNNWQFVPMASAYWIYSIDMEDTANGMIWGGQGFFNQCFDGLNWIDPDAPVVNPPVATTTIPAVKGHKK